MDKTEPTKLKKTRVISPKNLPAKAPIFETIVIAILIKGIPFEGTGRIWVVFLAASIALMWAFAFLAWAVEERIDIFGRFDTIAKKIVADDLKKSFSDTVKKYGGTYGKR